MSAQWFLARNNQRLGPYSPDQLTSLVASGHLLPVDMLLEKGSQKWVQAGSVPGLFAPAATVPQMPPPLTPQTKPPMDRTARVGIVVGVVIGVVGVLLPWVSHPSFGTIN